MFVGYTPHSSVSWSATPGGARARRSGGACGTSRTTRAAAPVEVGTISAAASSSSASSTAACMTAWPVVSRLDVLRAAVDDGRLLGGLGDLRHRPHGLDRIGADAGLGREHHRGRAVDHGVGDVGRLGARRLRRLDHRLEHLRRGDHELARLRGAPDRVLLHQRHARDAGLDAVVAARDHHAVGHRDDLVEVLVGLDLLDLGDQPRARAELVAAGRAAAACRRRSARTRARRSRRRARPRGRCRRGPSR